MSKPTYYEFFAGGGMARAGLGQGWECLFANDFDAKKAESYKANWGSADFKLADIHSLEAKDLPGHADLAWASFPCQDLSLAGNGAGLKGGRSGAFWGFWDLIHGLKLEKRAPRILVLENVIGALTSNGGADFTALCRAVHELGYNFGALTIDAAHFVPQSRPRLFIVAARRDVELGGLAGASPSEPWASSALRRARAQLPAHVVRSWRWWQLPPPQLRTTGLTDILETDPVDAPWHMAEETARFISMMSPVNLARIEAAKKSGARVAGTIYRRTRHDENGEKIQRAEIRMDGTAGCLRTPGGGSSRQFIVMVEGKIVRTRLLSAREAARLMGLPDSYKLPDRYNEAYHLAGDGLAVPAVRYVAEHLLLPLLGLASFQAAAE